VIWRGLRGTEDRAAPLAFPAAEARRVVTWPLLRLRARGPASRDRPPMITSVRCWFCHLRQTRCAPALFARGPNRSSVAPQPVRTRLQVRVCSRISPFRHASARQALSGRPLVVSLSSRIAIHAAQREISSIRNALASTSTSLVCGEKVAPGSDPSGSDAFQRHAGVSGLLYESLLPDHAPRVLLFPQISASLPSASRRFASFDKPRNYLRCRWSKSCQSPL